MAVLIMFYAATASAVANHAREKGNAKVEMMFSSLFLSSDRQRAARL